MYKNDSKNYISYFTEEGYMLFLKSTFKEIKKIIKKKDYRIDIINLDSKNIVYKDRYQIVVETNKLTVSREFCGKVRELAKE